MSTSTISTTVLHSSHSAVARWHPTSDTHRFPAGDHHSRLFLSLINCCGLASRLSLVLSVFCSLASVTRFTRWDWHFAKASGVHLNEPVFLPKALYLFWHLYHPTLFPRANYWNPSPPRVQVELRLVAVLQEELGNVIPWISDCSLNFLMQWSLLLCCEAVMQEQSVEDTSTGSEIKTLPQAGVYLQLNSKPTQVSGSPFPLTAPSPRY